MCLPEIVAHLDIGAGLTVTPRYGSTPSSLGLKKTTHTLLCNCATTDVKGWIAGGLFA